MLDCSACSDQTLSAEHSEQSSTDGLEIRIKIVTVHKGSGGRCTAASEGDDAALTNVPHRHTSDCATCCGES